MMASDVAVAGRPVAARMRWRIDASSVEQNLRLADHVHVLSRGRIVYSGAPAELAGNAEVKSRYLGV
jgi:ABC-type lipopolysaccharide export system ATPase subunit